MAEKNEIKLSFDSYSRNESLARVVVASLITPLDPTVEEMADVKTAVSEAVTNCVIHGYPGVIGTVEMECSLEGSTLTVIISDQGVGIEDIPKAMEPLYTTKPALERSGMGFAFMEAFMADLEVTSSPGERTKVKMTKRIGAPPAQNL